jgi:putative oxidoreductase
MRRLLGRFERQAYALMRMAIGFLFFFHGLQKLFGLFGGKTGDYLTLRGLAGLLETVGGPLVAIGLYATPTAFILSGEMAFAYFLSHGPRGFWPIENGGEMAVAYCFVFLYIATRGAGVWAVDRAGR